MLHPTPIQHKVIENAAGQPLRDLYKNFETTFVILHPFLIAKAGCNIKFEIPYPDKKHIIEYALNISWQQILEETGLENIKQVDQLLAYLHCARRVADKTNWQKLMKVVHTKNYGVPEVDYFPEIITNKLFTSIKSLGYADIKISTLWEPQEVIMSINAILSSDEQLPSVATITTPDNKILMATEFDEVFSYLSSTKQIVDKLVSDVGLEGFYCNETTKAGWSYTEQKTNIIDWDSK